MEIILNYGSLYENMARSLSSIGKRAKDNNGNNLFSNITLSSAEKPLVCDFFANAFTEICAAIGRFVTTETRHVSTFSNYANVAFWTDQDPATLVDSITVNLQLLYRYNQRKLYQASLSFPFETYQTGSSDVFKYGNDYYNNSLALIVEPTDEQKASAVTLDYLGTDPQTITADRAGMLAGYNGAIYSSQRQASFSEITPSANTIYYGPSGVAYRWLYEAMQITPSAMDNEIELVVTVPDNWNSALTLSFRQALYNYCIAFALHSWFTITAPHIAEKYLHDTQRQIVSALQLIHEKKSPITSTSFTNPTGTVQ